MDREAEVTRNEGGGEGRSSNPRTILAGRYRLAALLGKGGMGSVYLADDIELGVPVALKMMLRVDPEHDAVFAELLRSEVRLARQVTHPNVARTYDIGEHEGDRFLTMEYVDGESLAGLITRIGPFGAAPFVRLALELAEGLAAAHAAGVLHRDLKPHNVLLAHDHPKIADFGAALSLRDGPDRRAIGTLSYMAPEQFEGVVDERSDVFGLGGIFYSLLTAANPFQRVHPGERPLAPPNPCDRRPDLPVPVGQIVAKCLARSPAERFPHVRAVAEALASVMPLVQVANDEGAATVTSPADRILRAIEDRPRYVLLEETADADPALAPLGLVAQIAEHINELAGLRAVVDAAAAHEACVHVTPGRQGDRLVLDVRLIGRQEGLEFWSGSFDATPGDAVGLARATAHGIERALSVTRARPAPYAPLGGEAEQLYLFGRARYSEFWAEPLERAADAFDQALVRAPGHPLVLAALAAVRVRQAFLNVGTPESARQAARVAVGVAAGLPDVHAALASVHLLDGDGEAAAKCLLHALKLAPGHLGALATLAGMMLDVGAPVPSRRIVEAVHQRDPTLDLPRTYLARMYALLGQWAAVDDVYASLGPTFAKTLGLGLRVRFATWRHDVATVRSLMDEVERAGGRFSDLAFRTAFMFGRGVLEGVSPTADEETEQPRTDPKTAAQTRAFLSQISAEVEAYLGHTGQAVTLIESALRDGLFDVFWLDRCPLFDELRGSARFEAARDVAGARARRILSILHQGESDA